MRDIPYIKVISSEESDAEGAAETSLRDEIIEAVEELKNIKSGKAKGIPAREVFDEV
jgi:hypothetical protein